jgi:hypothetical protein
MTGPQGCRSPRKPAGIKKTARKIQGGKCIKKERAGYSFINLFIIVARGEMNFMK